MEDNSITEETKPQAVTGRRPGGAQRRASASSEVKPGKKHHHRKKIHRSTLITVDCIVAALTLVIVIVGMFILAQYKEKRDEYSIQSQKLAEQQATGQKENLETQIESLDKKIAEKSSAYTAAKDKYSTYLNYHDELKSKLAELREFNELAQKYTELKKAEDKQ